MTVRFTGLLFAFALLCTFPAVAAQPGLQPPAKFQAQAGSMPGYRFQTLAGEQLSLDPYLAQKVLIVNFWATWCPPCVKELPSLDKLATLLPADRFKVVTIAQQNETAEVSGYFKRSGLKNLPQYIDPAMQASRAFGMRGLPTTIIIDGNGQIIGRVEGDLDWAAPEVVAWLKTL